MITEAELKPQYWDDDDDDDDEEEEDDDSGGDCGASHVCIPGGSMRGFCITRAGHSGAHFCGLCNHPFY